MKNFVCVCVQCLQRERIIKANVQCVCAVCDNTLMYSAINSCPVSPDSNFGHRVPNFDFNVMAKYASTLLSSQEQASSDNEVRICDKMCTTFLFC